MNKQEAIRDATARNAALTTYAKAYDHFAELEQRFALAGREVEATGAHCYALMLLRAYRGDLDDPQPRGLVT